MILRVVKSVLVASVGAWAVLVAYGNLADYGANWAFVQHVLAMDTVFTDNPLKSRAITDPTLQRIAYALIIATEWLMARRLPVRRVATLPRAPRPRAPSSRPRYPPRSA